MKNDLETNPDGKLSLCAEIKKSNSRRLGDVAYWKFAGTKDHPPPADPTITTLEL